MPRRGARKSRISPVPGDSSCFPWGLTSVSGRPVSRDGGPYDRSDPNDDHHDDRDDDDDDEPEGGWVMTVRGVIIEEDVFYSRSD